MQICGYQMSSIVNVYLKQNYLACKKYYQSRMSFLSYMYFLQCIVHVKINLSEFDQNLFGISFTPPLFPSIVFLLLHESLSYGYLPLNLSLFKASVPLSTLIPLFLSPSSLSHPLYLSRYLNWDSVVNFYYENIAAK